MPLKSNRLTSLKCEGTTLRQVIADMLRDWDKRYPGRIETMFSAMQNVVPSHLSKAPRSALR
jgi:tRNA(Ile)-lysidine synthase TilS/MesJ